MHYSVIILNVNCQLGLALKRLVTKLSINWQLGKTDYLLVYYNYRVKDISIIGTLTIVRLFVDNGVLQLKPVKEFTKQNDKYRYFTNR